MSTVVGVVGGGGRREDPALGRLRQARCTRFDVTRASAIASILAQNHIT